jgi:predicted Na+-dependent transporter
MAPLVMRCRTMLAAVLGFYFPSLFAWFNDSCITAGLMAVMLGMGLTLTFGEIASVFTKTPQLLLLGMVRGWLALSCWAGSARTGHACACAPACAPACASPRQPSATRGTFAVQALQYTVLPAIGWAISRCWGLTSSLAIGVALVRPSAALRANPAQHETG